MMNKKRRRNKTKLPIIILTSILLITAMFVFNYYNYMYELKLVFRNLGASIQNALVLKTSNISNQIIIGIDSELIEENIELKKMLGITINNYSFITCSIINRDIAWNNTLTLNKGKKDSIDIDMAVINNNGLIGRIVEVGDNYSVVELITNKNFNKIAVDIKGVEENTGILDKHDDNYLIIKNVNKNANINIGDKVYTNGLGGIYPAGIYIGEVIEIRSDSLDLSKELKIKINKMYNNMRYVNVVRR